MNKRILIAGVMFMCGVQGLRSVQGPNAVQNLNDVANLNVIMPLNVVPSAELDVRDAQNRPSTSVSKKTALADLFQHSFYRLTVIEAPHLAVQAWDSLNLYSTLLINSILHGARRLLASIQQAWIPPQKRFVHNVDKLWVTFIVGFLGGLLSTRLFRSVTPCLTLPLRC